MSELRDKDAFVDNKVLEAQDLCVGYGPIPVLREVNISVAAGQVVALLGPNGAGKTTALLAMSGILKPISGRILFDGNRTNSPLHKRARRGMAFVTEERSVFKSLSVRDNLRAGRCDLQVALELFPELAGRFEVRGGLLSGGEQQMLTLGRALARRPKLLLADELSLGLSPLISQRLLGAVRAAADKQGTAVLLVEQQIRRALRIADYVYVLNRGAVVLEGTGPEMRDRVSDVQSAYLGEHAPA